MAGDTEAAAASGEVERRASSVGSENRKLGNLLWGQRNDFFLLRGGLHDQWHAEVLLQEMLPSGETRGGSDIIRETGNTKDDSVGGFLGAEPCAAEDTALAKRPRQTQNASQSPHIVSLLRGNSGK